MLNFFMIPPHSPPVLELFQGIHLKITTRGKHSIPQSATVAYQKYFFS